MMSYTPDPAVVAAFDLIANHNYSAQHAAQTTGCTDRALRDYLTNRGERGFPTPRSLLPASPLHVASPVRASRIASTAPRGPANPRPICG